jgi:hypothetical protein
MMLEIDYPDKELGRRCGLPCFAPPWVETGGWEVVEVLTSGDFRRSLFEREMRSKK